MKTLLAIILAVASTQALAVDFIHPMDFDGSKKQKDAVIQYIQNKVKRDYCDKGLDMCQDVTLRMMEKENLNAFKSMTKAKNRKVMNSVIKSYCNSGLDMCDYITIKMMYGQNLKASQDKLEW